MTGKIERWARGKESYVKGRQGKGRAGKGARDREQAIQSGYTGVVCVCV